MPGDNIVAHIVRIGEVQSVDSGRKTARVKFDSLGGLISGPLKVLQHSGASVTVDQGGEHDHAYSGSTETAGDPSHSHDYSGSTEEAETHTHTAAVNTWLPSIGQMVVCLYLPVDDGDGFVLGGLP